jgi:hypothetical protein
MGCGCGKKKGTKKKPVKKSTGKILKPQES